MKLAKLIRKEVFEYIHLIFLVASRLFISMLLSGPNVRNHSVEFQSCLTIGQLIHFNMKHKPNNAEKQRHSKCREMPLPIYLGLSIHTMTRNEKIIHILHSFGISISYDRIIKLENLLASAVSEQYKDQGVVCPVNLRKNVYVVEALDNIDYNPSSATSKDSFQATAISIFQCPTKGNCGDCRERVVIGPSSNSTQDHSLSENYTNVLAVTTNISEVVVPSAKMTESQCDLLEREKLLEFEWTDHAIQLLFKGQLDKDNVISWAAFHASKQIHVENSNFLSTLLPLFPEKAASLSMVKHDMGVIKSVTDYLNPEQVPVMAVNQPLFALAKYVQWTWPQTFGEDKFVIMFGGLHIEMCIWDTIGAFLDSSG